MKQSEAKKVKIGERVWFNNGLYEVVNITWKLAKDMPVSSFQLDGGLRTFDAPYQFCQVENEL